MEDDDSDYISSLYDNNYYSSFEDKFLEKISLAALGIVIIILRGGLVDGSILD